MRAFIWWLRSLFCRHDFRVLKDGAVVVEYDSGGTRPYYAIKLSECTKCGWRWTQKDYL